MITTRVRTLAVLFSILFATQAVAALPSGKNNPKHAILVLDADSNSILYEENGNARRYPASLTKMMTLYMLFDALRTGKVKMHTKMKASKKAASQPQTNVGLRTGDRIRVDEAIKTLVVRSANDVAVVVAETLGRSEWNFGVMMTSKARELGMKNTVFRNPHGLPDKRQYTTAYDMATLGKALRRDFPQYYHLFKTQTVRFKGRTYTSHNRVLKRFGGVDGIKTGYIRMSGFNLVSSVKKDGFDIVAVVMGGTSGKSRDDRMVALLDQTFYRLKHIKDQPRYIAAAPVPHINPAHKARRIAEAKRKTQDAQLAAAHPNKPQEMPAPRVTFSLRDIEDTVQMAEREQASYTKEKIKTQELAAPIPALKPKPKAQKNSIKLAWRPVTEKTPAPTHQANTLDFQMAMLDTTSSKRIEASRNVDPSRNWAIQVGAFRDEATAQSAVKKAFGLVRGDLKDAYVTINKQGDNTNTIHRARLGNLSREQAYGACEKLVNMQSACFPLENN